MCKCRLTSWRVSAWDWLGRKFLSLAGSTVAGAILLVMWPSGAAQWRATFFLVPQCLKWRFKCLNEVPMSPKSVSVWRICLLLLLLAINAVNALWHPHTPVPSIDEREIWAVKIVRSSCQSCKTWIFRIKISSIVWVEAYEGSFVVLIYSIDNKCIFMTCVISVNVGSVNGLLLFTPSHCLNWC